MDASLKASCAGFLHAAYAESPVTDMVMYNQRYDRHGAIQTSGLNLMKDLSRFLILLFTWQRFTEADWGIVPLGPGQTFICDNDIESGIARYGSVSLEYSHMLKSASPVS